MAADERRGFLFCQRSGRSRLDSRASVMGVSIVFDGMPFFLMAVVLVCGRDIVLVFERGGS